MFDETQPKVTTIVHTVKPTSRSRDANVEPTPVDSFLQRRLLDSLNQCDPESGSTQPIIAVLRETLAPAMIQHFVRDQSGSLRVPSDDDILQRLPPQAGDKLLQWAGEVCEQGKVAVHRLSGANTWTVVAAPVMFRHRAPEVLCAVFREKPTETPRVASVLQLGATHLTLWEVTESEKTALAESRSNAALLELLSTLDDTDDLSSAYQILVDDLQKFLGCRRVAIGTTRSGKFNCRLVSVSGLCDFDKRSDFAADIESALNEAILHDDVIVASQTRESANVGDQAHQNLLASSQATTLISSPLKTSDDAPVGAWIFFQDKPEVDTNATQNFVQASRSIVGPRLAMLRRAESHPLLRPAHAMLQAAGSRKFLLGMLALALIVAGFAVPTNYRISCDCQLEPVSRRFVAAPYDGTLEESLVEAGQIVSAGALLARMDPRELHWELSGLIADHASEKKKRDAAAAREEFALAQQSSLELERLSLKIQLIEHRLDNLEIKSPIDGIVIAGDLKKSEGAPLSIGQAMFEIGPLDQMIIEVAIPEREILYVETGMEVELRLDAAQHETINGTIERISPRSETRDNASVYVAEVSLDNRDGTWRPGMKGTAKVISDPHPLAWNLMHRAWESLAMWVGV